jgi:transcriptional regulator with XRE-family HTH domain
VNTDVKPPSDHHPTLFVLVDYHDGNLPDPEREVVESHVRGCGWCSTIVESIDDDFGPIEPDVPSEIRLPQALVAVVRHARQDAFGVTEEREPEPGDLWLLEWNGTEVLGAVLGQAAERRRWEVVPITAAGPGDTGSPEVVGSAESPLGVALRLWPSLRADVDQGVFFRWYATASQEVTSRASAHSADQQSKSWEAAMQLADLSAAMQELGGAEWLPAQTEVAPARLIDERMRALHLTPTKAARAAGIRPARVMQLVRGEAIADPDEARRLASVLGVDPAVLSGAPDLPEPLIDAVSKPQWRPMVRLRALREGVSEAVARLAVATEVLALPARTSSGERDAEAWKSLIRQYLDVS